VRAEVGDPQPLPVRLFGVRFRQIAQRLADLIDQLTEHGLEPLALLVGDVVVELRGQREQRAAAMHTHPGPEVYLSRRKTLVVSVQDDMSDFLGSAPARYFAHTAVSVISTLELC
jgi:hypothetical protein